VQQKTHIRYLDGWRGCSIALLLVGHFNLQPIFYGKEFNPSSLAVECFFALSGRLMAEILFVRETSLATFYVHRVSRIVPALWLFAFSMLIAEQFTHRLGVTPFGVLTAITFTRNYFMVDDCLGHIWSLCVEEHAYILLSLVALLHRVWRFNLIAVLSGGAFAMAINGAVQQRFSDHAHIYWQSDVRIASILVPAALYLKFRYAKLPSLVPVLSILTGFAIFLIGSVPAPVRYTIPTLLISFGLATAENLPKVLLDILSSRPLRILGVLSYTLYLWQQPFTHYDAFSLPVLLGMLAGVTLVTFYGFEKPMRSLINRTWSQRRTRSIETHATQVAT
jgi:peptidoglycan/LPS O-acetylase OafA/YrhL